MEIDLTLLHSNTVEEIDISNTYKNLSSKLNEIRDNYKDLGISDTTLQMLE